MELNLETAAELAANPPPAISRAISRNPRVLRRQFGQGVFPAGVVVKLAGRWWVNRDALIRWIAAGGALADASAAPKSEQAAASGVA